MTTGAEFLPSRYVFVREFGTRHGELHRERGGVSSLVSRAYLTDDGWLMHSGGGWLQPGFFSMQHAPLPASKVSIPVTLILADAMRNARLLLGERFHAHPPIDQAEPYMSPERDNRHHDSF